MSNCHVLEEGTVTRRATVVMREHDDEADWFTDPRMSFGLSDCFVNPCHLTGDTGTHSKE